MACEPLGARGRRRTTRSISSFKSVWFRPDRPDRLNKPAYPVASRDRANRLLDASLCGGAVRLPVVNGKLRPTLLPIQWGILVVGNFRESHMPLVIEQKDLDRLPITIDPQIVSGTPVFRGTRVPVEALINNLEGGLSLDEFLNNFPTVTREQALQVLEFSKSTLLKLRKTRLRKA